ncbi:Aste57867_16442 [Aphanomyces stellatus]|uniref:Aste57867_16442 protein n=1 Tax=Aphanomyces stellatus TaxID=120398 RepID=A0A485KEP6_9STRA|nr:hypothetical protein As57867_016385 [Aphanomyces stellatus]KAF0716012.1 hypothetical protein As57867_003067 [Aphanomyces stellatus]VFT80255.1 Aste57867_3076 [Aphanomyces stellatus]VFT93217.1 Aste57867_16442 [Aphanomyces stellatus]
MAVPLDVLARASPSCGLDKLQRVFGHFDSLAKTGGGVQRRDASMQCMVHLVANPTTGPTLRWLVDTMDKVDIDDVLRHHGVQALRSVLLLTPHVQIHHVDMAQFLVDYGVVAVELMRAHVDTIFVDELTQRRRSPSTGLLTRKPLPPPDHWSARRTFFTWHVHKRPLDGERDAVSNNYQWVRQNRRVAGAKNQKFKCSCRATSVGC